MGWLRCCYVALKDRSSCIGKNQSSLCPSLYRSKVPTSRVNFSRFDESCLFEHSKAWNYFIQTKKADDVERSNFAGSFSAVATQKQIELSSVALVLW